MFEAKFMLPWNFSEEAAVEKHMPQLQHNMWVTAVLSLETVRVMDMSNSNSWAECSDLSQHAQSLPGARARQDPTQRSWCPRTPERRADMGCAPNAPNQAPSALSWSTSSDLPLRISSRRS